jgi:HlyD family secretion protein
MVNLTVNQPSPHQKPPMRWRKWMKFGIPILLILLGGLGPRMLGSNLQRPTNTVVTQPVERKSVAVTISANGTVSAERSINLSPKSAGVIKSLLVKEGDRVRQGQLIAVMDDSNLRGQYQQMQGQLAQQEANLQRLIAGNRPEDIAKAEAQLAEARANLQQLKSGNRSQDIAQAEARLQQQKATLQQRETDAQRYQQLYEQGAIAKQTLDQKIGDRDVARAQVREATQALALQNAGARPEEIAQAEARVAQQTQTVAALRSGNRSEDIDQARAQVQSAQGALATIQAELDDTQIRAPFDGIVIKKYADVGAFVSPSMSGSSASASSSSILTLSSQRQQVVVNLSESQLAKVKVGQSVTIQADAIPSETFRGQVEQIAPQASVSQNVTSFEVRVKLTSANADQLKAGMNVEADFAIQTLDNALLVPNAAVVQQAEGAGVYVLDQNRNPVFKPIDLGVTVGQTTEVKSGLNGDEQVLVSPPAKDSKSTGGFSFPPRPPQ